MRRVEKILGGFGYSRPRISGIYARPLGTIPRHRPFNWMVSYCAGIASRLHPSLKELLMQKKTMLITQVIMTFMMATAMSGIMSLLALGPTTLWLSAWPKTALIAWPIAFVLGAIAFPLSARIASFLVNPRTGASSV